MANDDRGPLDAALCELAEDPHGERLAGELDGALGAAVRQRSKSRAEAGAQENDSTHDRPRLAASSRTIVRYRCTIRMRNQAQAPAPRK